MLESLRDLLEPFARYTQFVSGESFTTISGVIPVVMELEYHLQEVNSVRTIYFCAILYIIRYP